MKPKWMWKSHQIDPPLSLCIYVNPPHVWVGKDPEGYNWLCGDNQKLLKEAIHRNNEKIYECVVGKPLTPEIEREILERNKQ